MDLNASFSFLHSEPMQTLIKILLTKSPDGQNSFHLRHDSPNLNPSEVPVNVRAVAPKICACSVRLDCASMFG